jgi:hypothetical protein
MPKRVFAICAFRLRKKRMSDALAKRNGDWVESWVKGARESVRGAISKVGESGVAPYVKSGGSALVHVTEGFAVGGMLGAAKVRFGVDASPALMGASAALSILASGASPTFSAHAAHVAGQAAAVMADRRTQSFLGSWMGGSPSSKGIAAPGAPGALKPVGPAIAGESGGDNIIRTAERIARRQQNQT